jgi:PAS domain S-box-containing protein
VRSLKGLTKPGVRDYPLALQDTIDSDVGGRKNSRPGKRLFLSSLSFGIIVLALWACGPAFAGPDPRSAPLRFHRLTIEDGLSQSSVYSIVQDNQGFLWIGTEDGLNKFDGYSFKIYKNDPKSPSSLSYNFVKAALQGRSGALWFGTYGGGVNAFDPKLERFSHYENNPTDPASLGDNFVNCLSEDPDGTLWVGTDHGLNKFDPASGKFVRSVNDPKIPGSLGIDKIMSITKDRSGLLWIGTSGGGLDRFDPITGQVTPFRHDPKNLQSLSHNAVRTVCEDRRGVLWIGTENGLDAFHPENGQWAHFSNSTADPQSLSSDFINSIFESRRGEIWVGTLNGLNKFIPEKGAFLRFYHDENDLTSLSDPEIFSICEDRSGVLWIGTHVGINKLDQEGKQFVQYKKGALASQSLINNFIRAIYQDSSGLLWIGSYGGLTQIDRARNAYRHYTNSPNDPDSLSNNRVMSICEDKSGPLWVGTFGGLDQLDRGREKFIHYANDPKDPSSLSSDRVRVVYLDRTQTLWVGTENGLDRFDRRTGRFFRFLNKPDDPRSISDGFIYAIAEDRSGALWIGTLNGLNKLDPRTGTFERYVHKPDDFQSLSSSEVLSIYEDQTGVLWAGTSSGLNRMDRTSGTFTYFSEKDGLPNNLIYDILEDAKGNLWLSTNRGLSKFNPASRKFRNYDGNDGLQSDEFTLGACFQTAEGEMLFGGINGFTSFFPDQILDNPFMPSIVITDFQISNRPVAIGPGADGRTILNESITQTKDIEISFRHRVISFEFAALHFAAPNKNKYSYILEGFEKEWNAIGNRRFATYTNLPPGRYVFRVKGSNNDGLWNEQGASVRLHVKPPYWQTWWFRAAALLAGLALIVVFFRIRTRSIRERARTLEERVQERTTELSATNESLQNEIGERRRTETALRQSEEKYRSLADQIPIGIYRTTLDGKILYANPALAAILDYESVEELAKASAKDAYVNSLDRGRQVDQLKAGGGVTSIEIEFKTRKGRQILVRDTGRIIHDPDRKIDYIDGIIEDITERNLAEELIKSALKEKEVLLKEIHHRVKNNMQIISSLLRLQSTRFEDKNLIDIFRASQSRIRSMALIHEGLYRSVDLARINFSDYLARLASQLFSMYRIDPRTIELKLDVHGVDLDLNMAIPCAMIINELMTNALKYAFPDNRKGEVRITMNRDGQGKYTLIFKDNGVGISKDIDFRKTKSLGMRIITDLVAQLEGTIEMQSGAGTEYTITF